MSYCSSCGQAVDPQHSFCLKCGVRLITPDQPAASAVVPATCPTCGQSVEPEWAYCAGCRAPLATAPAEQPPAAAPPSAPFTPSRTGRAPLVTLAVVVSALLAVGGLVLVLMAAPSGRWDLLPSMAVSAVKNGPGSRLNPSPPVATAPALDIRPAPGLRLQAPANALDKPREFSATALSGAQLLEIAEKTRPDNAVILAGWRLDAGMGEDDLFPGEVTVSVDLNHLQIPRVMHPFATLLYVADDGTISPLAADLRGPRLCTEVRHNGLLAVRLVFFWIPALSAAGYYGWTVDRAEVPKGDFSVIEWKPGNARFILRWPVGWPARNPKVVDEMLALLLAALKKNPLPGEGLGATVFEVPSGTPHPDVANALSDTIKQAIRTTMHDAMRDPLEMERHFQPTDSTSANDASWSFSGWLERMSADPDVLEYVRRMRDADWLRDNLLPVKVGHATRALDRAADYLSERGFRKPGTAGVSLPTNVYFVQQGGAGYGEARNTWTTRPFIVVNANHICPLDAYYFLDGVPAPLKTPANPPSPQRRQTFKGQFDDMQLTLLHELFHIVQGAYEFYSSTNYLWFHEATAVLLEIEGARDYREREWVTTEGLTTDRTLAFLFHELDRTVPWKMWKGAPEEEWKAVQGHGYGASFFLEFLRDRYFGPQPDRFLPALMDDFASFRGGTIASLHRVTSGSEDGFLGDFELFVRKHAEELWTLSGNQAAKSPGVRRDEQIDRLKTFDFWTFRPYRPLSVAFRQVRTPRATVQGKADELPVYAISMNGLGEHGVALWRSSANSDRWARIPGDGGTLPREATHRLMRIQRYITVPDELAGMSEALLDGQGPLIFGMESLAAPSVRVEDERVEISWRKSPHAQLTNSKDEPIAVAEYRAALRFPDGSTINFGADKPSVWLPVKTVRDLLLKQRKGFMRRMWYTIGQYNVGRNDIGPLLEITEAFAATEPSKIGAVYREIGRVAGRPIGPESKAALFEIDDDDATTFGISGRWMGKVPFSEGMMMRLDINEKGRDFVGTMHFGGEKLPLRGKARPGVKAWTIQMRDESKVWLPAWMVLQKLPGNRLYMYAPPCLLKQVEKGRVDLGWQHEPGEMNWTDLLRLILADLEAMQQNDSTQEQ